MTEKTPRIYTVTELTKDIRFLLEDSFHDVWVEGEISNYTESSSGHVYFSLKDEGGFLNCVLFKSSKQRIKFTLEDGIQVLLFGRISVYDKRGQYQLYVSTAEPKGVGSLQLAFEQLKKKLGEEGLFDEEKKKPIPYLPKRIGVVTSGTGAAIRDILNVIKRRFNKTRITIYPVKVQGEEAKGEIAQAIKDFDLYNQGTKEPIEVLIVGRGGGSIEDLWPFNEEIVARAIYECEIPVISAVGHEVDFTISDFVSDLRAPTPSAAAELVVPLKEDVTDKLAEYKNRIKEEINEKIEYLQSNLNNLAKSYVLRSPLNFLNQLEQQIDDLAKHMQKSFNHIFNIKTKEFASIVGKLNALSPLSVLERGYSITFNKNKAVKDIKDVEKGDVLKTKIACGEITSRVEYLEGGK